MTDTRRRTVQVQRRGATGGRPVRPAAPATPAPPGRSPRRGSWLWLAAPPRALASAGWSLLPLRAFLGFTFCFAGLQKLANPRFLTASDPASIQAQLAGAARRSPIHSLISPLAHVAIPLGILIALSELAIGVGALLGLWTRIAAAAGALLSLMLFLTISFHSSPYYTGADIVFVFAWIPLILGGDGGVLSVDAALTNFVRHNHGAEPLAVVPISFATVRRACGAFEDGLCARRRGAPCEPGPCPFLRDKPPPAKRLEQVEMDRRTFSAKGAVTAASAVAAVVAGGAVAGLGRAIGGTSKASNTPTLGAKPAGAASTTTPTTAPGAASTTTAAPASGSHPPGTRIGPAADVPVGQAASFTDPRSGDPALVIQPHSGTFLAFDAVCPHAGCTVEYDPSNSIFICPCHGSEFNGSTGAVETGPAQQNLARISISEGSDGQLYVT